MNESHITYTLPEIKATRIVAIVDDFFCNGTDKSSDDTESSGIVSGMAVNVARREPLKRLLGNVLAENEIEADVIYVKASEENKTLATVSDIISRLVNLEADRETFLIGIGGGIITDITGFTASIYKRGIRFGLVPTTLLAQVDAAIGGKNGVNFDRFKNLAGCFSRAEFIYINPRFCRTLSRRETLCGAAEMLKTFIISDRDYYNRAIAYFSSGSYNEQELSCLISRAVDIKCEIVSGDPLDRGDRRLLNLGHTFGHALERYCYRYLHGEAVAAGIVMAARLSANLGMADSSLPERIAADFERIGLPVRCDIDNGHLWNAIVQDKKRIGKVVNFVLPVDIGNVVIKPLECGKDLL